MIHPTQETLIVEESEKDLRLDKWLTLKFPTYSRTYFQSLIEEGNVLVNDKQCKKREKTRIGDEIEICFVLSSELSLEPENIPLEILYEDDDLLVINKPAGLVVHPAPGHYTGTFVHGLLFHCKSLRKELADPLRPGIVHRLDKDTSGALIAAKTSLAHRNLVSAFSERKVKKFYQAICIGLPTVSEINAPIQRHPTKRQEMAVCKEGGKQAITLIKTLEKGPHTSLLEIELITGRTHQIRVHLKHIGCPILGDSLYGQDSFNSKWKIQRQLLHAKRLIFPHPRTGETLDITAPLPSDMQAVITNLP
ncbi:MAG: RluA family pseudouridine synthase [Verrucomicrobia bacterium]|nr:RluA family pseudouridine synthase [Verrucomicrobiota bacterium]